MSIKQLTRKTKLTDVGKLKYSFNMNYKIIRSKLFLEKSSVFENSRHKIQPTQNYILVKFQIFDVHITGNPKFCKKKKTQTLHFLKFYLKNVFVLKA